MKTMLVRKNLILLLTTIILVIGAIGCDNKDTNQTLLDTVSEIERSTYELNTLKISYADYKKSTDKYLSKYFPSFYIQGNNIYAEEGLVKAITGKDYTEKDWAGMSLEEIKKIGEPLSQSIAINVISFNYKSCRISKVYEDSNSSSSLKVKYVFVRRDVQFDSPLDKKYTFNEPSYRKYTFMKDGKSYVLTSFKVVSVSKGQELTYGNEKVDFNQIINLE